MLLLADFLKFIDYEDINEELILFLKKKQVTKVIFTDLNFTNFEIIRAIERFASILILDHHRFYQDMNSAKTTFIIAKGVCASYLCYYLFSKAQTLEKLDWLVACASLSDWAFFENQEFMRKTYEKYKELFFSEERKLQQSQFWKLQYLISLAIVYFKKDILKVYNKIGTTFEEINDLEKYARIVQEEIDIVLKRFEKESIAIKEGYFWELSETKFSIREIVINELSRREQNKTYLICEGSGDFYKVSARRQDKTVDLPDLLRKLVGDFEDASAGGHIVAAGAIFPFKYREEFKKRIGIL